MIEVIFYSRPDCHLCDEARKHLESLQAEVPHRLKVIDVDSDLDLQRKYGFDVPVIVMGPYTLTAPVDLKDLEISLKAAVHRERQIMEIDQAIEDGKTNLDLTWTGSDKFSLWLSRHYLALLNVLVLVYFSLPFIAPVLMNIGWVTPAGWIYRAYSLVCHQLPYRSFFLFGEQIAYPRQLAHVDGLIPFEQVSDLNPNDILRARNYTGDETVGYKVAICERDVAIYAGILLFGLLFGAVNRKIPKIPWYLWVLVGLVPIGIDGVSQLVSQLFFALPARESTPVLRSITGFLFGFFSTWFFYPMVEESMQESLDYLSAKLRRFNKQQAWRSSAG